MPGSCGRSRTNSDAVDETDEVGKRAERETDEKQESLMLKLFFFFFFMSEFSMADFERKAQTCGRQA